MKFTLLNKIKAFRGCDNWGCGSFGASRGEHKHKGIDFAMAENDVVLAPFPCEIIRHGYAYSDLSYKLIEIRGLRSYSDYTAKIMYIKDFAPVGTIINEGQKIALADNIAARYSTTMTNHVHFELYLRGKLIDPTNLF
ncbi:M23 family metallopeptidase [Croceivirga radicis]|nr:M23 family metallopeptidase [Croceivirga radicis]